MMSNNIRSLLVKKYYEYIRVVTKRDLAEKVLVKGLDSDSTRTEEIMTSLIFSLDCYLPVNEADYIVHKKIRNLPVMEENKVVGILSVKDLVSCWTKYFGVQE